MYEIFVGHKALVWCSQGELEALSDRHFSRITDITGAADIAAVIRDLDAAQPGDMCVVAHDPQAAFLSATAQLQLEEAAGGVVLSADHRSVLLIFRRGHWDLPKGKLEADEATADGALREVREETGLNTLRITQELKLAGLARAETLHVYLKKNQVVLKQTHWFEMETNETSLIPQQSEDIEEARWVSRRDLAGYLPLMYRSLHRVMAPYIR
jgi:8-oxo-dGTP pyrophosphatase MutT (NUDIX family)